MTAEAGGFVTEWVSPWEAGSWLGKACETVGHAWCDNPPRNVQEGRACHGRMGRLVPPQPGMSPNCWCLGDDHLVQPPANVGLFGAEKIARLHYVVARFAIVKKKSPCSFSISVPENNLTIQQSQMPVHFSERAQFEAAR